MCGEQFFSNAFCTATAGSPPRVRGTEIRHFLKLKKLRITPACAGNSLAVTARWKAARDHPRVCGEQWVEGSACHKAVGSPPRVRGTVSRPFVCPLNFGITPACAGNSRFQDQFGSGYKDHPRVCGEQGLFLRRDTGEIGSPPRVRGTAGATTRAKSPKRITPACAGNSACRELFEAAQEDHPRVCGEQTTPSL